MVMKDVGKLSRELLRSHQGGDMAPYKMEELPGRRSEGDKSFSTQNDGGEGVRKAPSGHRLRASRAGYQQLASLWSDLWSAPGGPMADRPRTRSRHGARRPTGSEMERLEVIWDATWEATQGGPPQHADPPPEALSDEPRLNSNEDAAAPCYSVSVPWEPRAWAIGASSEPASVAGSVAGSVASRGSGCTRGPPSLYELPGFRSGDGESCFGLEETSEGSDCGGESARLDVLERRWDERWEGSGAAYGDATTSVETSSRHNRSLSLLHWLMSAISLSPRGTKAKPEAFKISDDLKDFSDRGMPPYIDPAASFRSN